MIPVKYTSTQGWGSPKFLVPIPSPKPHKYSVVIDGQQPEQGLVFPNRQEAHAWLKDNGYTKQENTP